MFKVSQSKVKSWRLCHQQYDYRYVQNIVPKVTPRPFMFGTIAHRMLEASANGQDPWEIFRQETQITQRQRMFKEEEEMYGDIAADIAYIMEEYFEFQPALNYVEIEGKFAEHSFEVRLGDTDIVCKGKIDGIAKGGRKLKWLVEHKTHKLFPPPEQRWRDLQSVLYIYVAEHLWGMKLDGTCWNYIRSKSPTRPQITQKGLLSERAIDTLPAVIEDVIRKNKLRGLYTTMIDQARAKRNEWFERIYTPIDPHITQHVVDDFTETAVEMSQMHGKSKVRNIGRHCDWCEYRTLCAAALQGMDEDFLKEREFKLAEQETDDATAE